MTAKLTYKDESKKVLAAADKGIFQGLNRAAFVIRQTAQGSIVKSNVPAAPGQPPHTRRGRLRTSLWYDVDKKAQVAVIGPRSTFVGVSAAAHEFGGRYKLQTYQPRPFMGPSLNQAAPRLGSQWEGVVTG